MGDFSVMIVNEFLQALPWLVGALATAGVLGWSPLGRSLRRRQGSDDAALREIHGELAELRQELAEVQERLDYSERLLTATRQAAPAQPITRRSLTPV